MSGASPSSGRLDARTLDQLYARMERRVYNVVYRWSWNAEEAHEVVQEAFVRLWAMRDRVRMETVEPLVFRIAVNLAAKRKRRRRLWGWFGLDGVREPASDQLAADAALARHRDERTLMQAIDALPERMRQVVVLTELSELPYAEVAEIVGIPVGTVASRRHHALTRLRAAMEAS